MSLLAASLLSVVLLTSAPLAGVTAERLAPLSNLAISLAHYKGPSTAANKELAQVDVGGILTRGGVKTPNILNSGQRSENCKQLVEWMAVLEREVPNVDFRTTAMDKIYPKAANLFRDEYFEPFYGKPFSKTTAEERRDYHIRVFRSCGPQHLSPEELATFKRLKTILERPFLLTTGSFSAPEVTAAVADRQNLIVWTKSVTQSLDRAEFDEINRAIKRAELELERLWPREQQEFINALTARQRTLARTPDSATLATRVQPQNGRQAQAPNLPVERRLSGGPLQTVAEDFDYFDAAMVNETSAGAETVPVEQVFQWLYDQKFKCLATAKISWNGKIGTTMDRQFGTKRFVIDCRSNCGGIRYHLANLSATGWHFGLSQPVPVLQLKTSILNYIDFKWVFTRKSPMGPEPSIRIHTWSNVLGDEGMGCRLD